MGNNRRSFLKKTAITRIGLGTYPSVLKADEITMKGTLTANGTQAAGATGQERLAISFWNFGLLSHGPNSIFKCLEQRMEETV